MADDEAVGSAGEAAVGHQGHVLAQPRPHDRRGGREHLGHAGAALGALIADDHHVAPDTEHLIEEVIKYTDEDSKLHILDIGTGSGCVLLSILRERKKFNGTGIDISKKSINISRYNAKKLKLNNRTKFYVSDVDNFLIGKYDIVISNPPYIENLSLKCLDRDVINFEPKLALDGGKDGFSEIIKVINKSSSLIKKNGIFILEIGYNQKNKAIQMLKNKGFYIKKVLKDYSKNDRCIISTKI